MRKILFSFLSVRCNHTKRKPDVTIQVLLCDLAHRVHILVEMKQGQCICPLSWSVRCNFTGEGKCNERGWACTPHPHQPGLILPSLNIRQKAAVATLCTLWSCQSFPEFQGMLSACTMYRTCSLRLVFYRTLHSVITGICSFCQRADQERSYSIASVFFF
jgi:hypothetical protein